MPENESVQLYYIASLKHTSKYKEHIDWWGPDRNGYTPVVGDYIGAYSHDEAMRLNDGRDCLAVPVELVRSLMSPEPYYKPGARFYDQRGPVVDNTRKVWNRLLAGTNPQSKPKPQVFRGQRRSFAWTPTEQASYTQAQEAADAG